MMIILHTHSEASEALWKAAQRNLRQYRDAAEAAGAEGNADALAVADALADAGRIVAGRIPTAPVRHLRTLSPTVRRIAADIHGDDPGAFCPLLAAEGITPEAGAGMAVRNGRQAGAEARLGSHRCPVCLAADVARTAPRAVADDPAIRWHS